jgi:hypothetical protein
MAKEDMMYKSIFVLFLGFLVFVMIILNKIHLFLVILDSYFVLFLFLGIIISLVGMSMLVVWNFNNRQPYFEEINSKIGTHFAPYLAAGIFFIVGGFTSLYYLKGLSRVSFLVSISSSILGIMLLLIGLKYFITEVLKKPTQKILPHY